MLRRFLRYVERLYGVKEELASVRDRRQKPQLPTFSVVAGLFLMACIQAGSLNGIGQALRNGPARCVWHKWLGGDLPSADRLGEVAAILDVDQLRKVLVRHYQAMMAILLLILLAVNLFHAWQSRSLKPELRDKFPIRFSERLLQGDFYHELKISTGPDPP